MEKAFIEVAQNIRKYGKIHWNNCTKGQNKYDHCLKKMWTFAVNIF